MFFDNKPLDFLKTVHAVMMLAVFFLAPSVTAQAATVNLSWDASVGATGYRVYQVQTDETTVNLSTRHVTDASPLAADVAATTTTISNLADGKTYYFAVKAYNGTSVSGLSNEVGKTLPAVSAAPVANFSADKTSGSAPLTVKFTDSSTNATAWSWNFGDNTTSTTQSPSKTYSSVGTYTVTLSVSGPGGNNNTATKTKTNYITVTSPTIGLPGASFTATPISGNAPLLVTFTDTSTGTVNTRNWDFGNGQTSTARSASITYNTAGSYTAKLTVGNSAGSTSTSKTISVTASTPVANFTPSAVSGPAPLTVTFTNTSTGTVTDYTWNFGDGSNGVTTQAKTNPSYTYSKPGTYTVSLTARGSSGSNTKTHAITISIVSAGTGGLVAAYSFEEVSGSTVVDASGKGNHGRIKEATRVTGKFGQALSFDGINDWVTVNSASSLDLTNGMTLEAWVYPTAAMNSWRSVLLKEQAGGLAYALYAHSDSNQPVASINIIGDQNLAGGATLTANTWVHLVATYDGVTERLYVNGTQVASKAQTGSMTVSTGALRIGGNSVWSEYFKGYIDEVRVYNRALTASEIKTDMTTAVAVSSPPNRLLGDQQTGAKTDTISKGTAKAFLKIADKTGQITNLPVYIASGSTALVAGLYSNNNGRPGTLLAQGTLNTVKAGSWNTITLPATAVTAGTTYWIAILSPGGSLQISDRVGGGTQPSETSPATTSATLPSTWWTTGTPSYDGPLAGYGAGY